MQTSHTPGPWCVAPLDGVYHGDSTKTKYHAVKKFWPGPGAYERIADCTDSAYPEANAKLIASAPDLAEALREFVAAYTDVDHAATYKPDDAIACVRANERIRAARKAALAALATAGS